MRLHRRLLFLRTRTRHNLIGTGHVETPIEHLFAHAKPFESLPFSKLPSGDGKSYVTGDEQYAAEPSGLSFIGVIPIAIPCQALQCWSGFVKKKPVG